MRGDTEREGNAGEEEEREWMKRMKVTLLQIRARNITRQRKGNHHKAQGKLAMTRQMGYYQLGRSEEVVEGSPLIEGSQVLDIS